MQIVNVSFVVTDWSKIAAVEHPGRIGIARWRSFEAGNLRVRIVEYSAGYEADHWCERGHVLFVLDGELTTHLKDGRTFLLRQGTSYQVANGEPHMSATESGAKLFIVD